MVMMTGLLMVLREDVYDDPTRGTLFGQFDFRQEIFSVKEGLHLVVEEVYVHLRRSMQRTLFKCAFINYE